MSGESLQTPRVMLALGNSTVASLIEDALAAEGFEIETSVGAGADAIDLLLVAPCEYRGSCSELVETCRREGAARVVWAACERPDDAAGDEEWLRRPFTPERCVDLCESVLGSPGAETARADLGSSSGADEPAGAGVVELSDTNRAVVEVRHSEDAGAGELVGDVEVEYLDTAVLEERAGTLEAPTRSEPSTNTPTLPEIPGETDAEELRELREETDDPLEDDAVETPRWNADDRGDREPAETPVDRRTAESGDRREGPEGVDASAEFRRAADLLAQSWERFATSASPGDRVDRLERALSALDRDGRAGLARSLEELEGRDGFSGRLESLSFVGLAATIRDRRLTGRLEIASRESGVAVHLDGAVVEEVRELGDRSREMLLECLVETEALTVDQFERLEDRIEREAGDLSVLSRSESPVDAQELLRARRLRARRLLSECAGSREGHFAFVNDAGRQRREWPELGLDWRIEPILVERLRVDRPGARGPLGTDVGLKVDGGIVHRVETGRLSVTERAVLDRVRGGATVAEVIAGFDREPPEIGAALRRLLRVGFLRRAPEVREEGGSGVGGRSDTSRETVPDETDAKRRSSQGTSSGDSGRGE